MRISQWIHRGVLTALVMVTTACNTILGINDVTPESTVGPDAQRCDIMPYFTLLAATPSTSVLSHHMTGGGASLGFLLNNDPKADVLVMDLYNGMGGHGVVNAVGSYTLTASDATLASCGICIGISTDFDSGTSTFSQTYFAAAQGTLKLDTFDATGIAGSLKNLKLRQIDLSGGNMRDIVGGCTVTIDDTEFTAKWSTAAAPTIAALRMIAPPR